MLAEVSNISISGEVISPKNRQVRVLLYSFVPGEQAHAATTELDESNKFSFVAYIREPVYGRLYYGAHSTAVFLEPGMQLSLRFDATNFETSLTFSGDGAAENTYLFQHRRTYEIGFNELQDKVAKLQPADFQAWARQRKEEQQKFLQSRINVVNPAFFALQQADIEYSWANELFLYAETHHNTKSKRYRLPEQYFAYIDQIKLHHYDVIHLASYRNFLLNYIKHQYTKTYKTQPRPEDEDYYSRMYALTADNLRSLPKFHVQAVFLVEAIAGRGLEVVKDEYIEFANECPVQPYKNELHELVKMQNVFEVAAPKVVFRSKDGREVPLNHLKGHIVLVRFDNDPLSADPAEIEQRDALLRRQLSGFKDVKFLQLSMADNREAYEQMVYADANEYLKSIINRPKPGQQVQLPAWSYVVLNREGLVVSNSLDDPKNELAIDKIKIILEQEEQQIAADQEP
ncbi:hypothetical protein [Cesiribacter andamanensis]|nr:hypothetical protein [Cesiribacter andamanensis]